MIRGVGREGELPRSAAAGFLNRLRTNTAGATLAIVGAALIPISAMIGSGLDMARAYMAQGKLQNACDAAALAARHEMSGAAWSTAARTEGERFFDFNFPADTMNAQNVVRTVRQSSSDPTTVEVLASADIPTTIMRLFGKQFIPIAVSCDADQDYGNNDIMVVLDVTLSMNCEAGTNCSYRTTEHTQSRLQRVRAGARGLYRALASATNSRTRYGFMPYSMSVNVGRDLNANWIRNPADYRQDTCSGSAICYNLVSVNHNTTWLNTWRGSGSYTTNTTSGCVEERATIGQSGSPISISSSTVSQADIDTVSTTLAAQKWSPYDATAQQAESGSLATLDSFCPQPARRLAEYANETAFQTVVTQSVSRAGGYTFHDLGIVWAARYLSSSGMFASSNPTQIGDIPVTKHIVFLTDGELAVAATPYTSYGVEQYDRRLGNSGSQDTRHRARFLAACTRAKSMGMTIWVIALDVYAVDDIRPCATSAGHFYTSNGSDLETVFAQIGQGIGRLRLTE